MSSWSSKTTNPPSMSIWRPILLIHWPLLKKLRPLTCSVDAKKSVTSKSLALFRTTCSETGLEWHRWLNSPAPSPPKRLARQPLRWFISSLPFPGSRLVPNAYLNWFGDIGRLKMVLITCVMSLLPKIAHAFVRAMLHRSWLPCAIWSLLLFIGTALLRLLLPDALCHPILSGLSLGYLLSKPLSFPHFCTQRRCLSLL